MPSLPWSSSSTQIAQRRKNEQRIREARKSAFGRQDLPSGTGSVLLKKKPLADSDIVRFQPPQNVPPRPQQFSSATLRSNSLNRVDPKQILETEKQTIEAEEQTVKAEDQIIEAEEDDACSVSSLEDDWLLSDGALSPLPSEDESKKRNTKGKGKAPWKPLKKHRGFIGITDEGSLIQQGEQTSTEAKTESSSPGGALGHHESELEQLKSKVRAQAEQLRNQELLISKASLKMSKLIDASNKKDVAIKTLEDQRLTAQHQEAESKRKVTSAEENTIYWHQLSIKVEKEWEQKYEVIEKENIERKAKLLELQPELALQAEIIQKLERKCELLTDSSQNLKHLKMEYTKLIKEKTEVESLLHESRAGWSERVQAHEILKIQTEKQRIEIKAKDDMLAQMTNRNQQPSSHFTEILSGGESRYATELNALQQQLYRQRQLAEKRAEEVKVAESERMRRGAEHASKLAAQIDKAHIDMDTQKKMYNDELANLVSQLNEMRRRLSMAEEQRYRMEGEFKQKLRETEERVRQHEEDKLDEAIASAEKRKSDLISQLTAQTNAALDEAKQRHEAFLHVTETRLAEVELERRAECDSLRLELQRVKSHAENADVVNYEHGETITEMKKTEKMLRREIAQLTKDLKWTQGILHGFQSIERPQEDRDETMRRLDAAFALHRVETGASTASKDREQV